MAYDADLAARIRKVVQGENGLTERRMFGGLAFLVHGHLAVSASGQGGLLLRIDPAETDALLDEPQVRRFEMRGREMNGWLRIDPAALTSDDELQQWVTRGISYARTLPLKEKPLADGG